MANMSTARKLGIAARIAGKQVKGSRTYGAAMSGIRTAFRHFSGIARQLWHEVTGFVFLAFAIAGGAALVREYTAYHAGKAASSRVAAAAGFTLMFAWFGATSFLRARKKR
jgi:putative exporter of polyketide antibiotics